MAISTTGRPIRSFSQSGFCEQYGKVTPYQISKETTTSYTIQIRVRCKILHLLSNEGHFVVFIFFSSLDIGSHSVVVLGL